MPEKKLTNRQVTRFNESVIHNFDLSIVMPFYKRLIQFTEVLKVNAQYFQRNGIEVIIVMDEPTEGEGVIQLIKQYPFINWKVVVNEKEHEPRNPAKVINVGIRCSVKKYILVSDPEKEFFTDIVLQMRELLENYPKHYAVGTLAFVEENEVVTKQNIDGLNYMDYGGLMVEKRFLLDIKGYDESFLTWGGEDDNILRRLDLAGIKKLMVSEAKSLHREPEMELNKRPQKGFFFSGKELKKFFYPKNIIVNRDDWGTDFDKIIYNWQNNSNAEELCRKYLDEFVEYEIKDSPIFLKKHKKLILCQAYNESEFMSGFLDDMAKYFDGIILLDDGSTDNTWQLAQHPKLLLKVKKTRNGFNDLENRNILLNIASFFKSEWFCFMDIDERFDERFVDFAAFENNINVDIVTFKGVYLWDSVKTYKKGVPYAENGILKIFRMFRPLGRMQINTFKKKLHFAAIPYCKNIINSKILFKDYGSLTKEKRKKKYEMYIKEDKFQDLSSYEYLLSDDDLLEIERIDLNKNNRGRLATCSPVRTHITTT